MTLRVTSWLVLRASVNKELLQTSRSKFRDFHCASFLLVSRRFPLAFLYLLQRLHRSVQGMSVISSEFGVCAFEGGVSVSFGLFDASNRYVSVSKLLSNASTA